LSGADITAHNNKIEECIISIRNWLKTSSSRDTIPYGNIIIERYNKFLEDFKNVCAERRINYQDMTFI